MVFKTISSDIVHWFSINIVVTRRYFTVEVSVTLAMCLYKEFFFSLCCVVHNILAISLVCSLCCHVNTCHWKEFFHFFLISVDQFGTSLSIPFTDQLCGKYFCLLESIRIIVVLFYFCGLIFKVFLSHD